ncbi:alpha/beta-hydrolase [Lophiostoma macrostomum CBS 122681]|uniref:Alpha/beta-hydrolase n=1 Tax=Lophiostoma macrostomum CBS 122681 TaxID=1314788 RepID=A0A6A6TPD2_9PLEO|nr:alpha/beta-hydrolase [Lophiostoma macrostomum CBS 122681]
MVTVAISTAPQAPQEARTFTFDHPDLGKLTGVVSPESVVQFRAIPYATIPGRFKRSVLLDNLEATTRDFTKSGFTCPQTFGSNLPGGGPFPGEVWPPASDEYSCLTLQINVPLACVKDGPSRISGLPLLTYIHGGGFVLGKIDEQHNTAHMVSQSTSSSPLVSASLQYRLGALGFFQTPEPESSNLGLYDQRNALLWLQRFASGFGADPGKHTVFGESAGAMSITYHMLSIPPPTGPLFQKAILMSGVPGPIGAPVPPDVAQGLYNMLLDTLGIKERGTESVAKLRELPVEQIVAASGALSEAGVFWAWQQDEEWSGKEKGVITWDKVPELVGNCDWVNEIVLGCAALEGQMFLDKIAFMTPTLFFQAMSAQLGANSAQMIMDAYNITVDMDQSLFLGAALRWIGDVAFDAPTHALAKYLTTHTTKKVYRYTFDIRNPFPGHGLYNLPHHWVDVYFIFKTFQFRYPRQKLKDISTQHAQLWLDFANGKAGGPWSEYRYGDGADAVIIVADEREGWVERTVAQDEELRELGLKRVEQLWDAWLPSVGQKYFEPNKFGPA